MSRKKKDPLRPLTEEERDWLARISRSQAEPASHVARAKQILAVADGNNYTEAAQKAGRLSGDAVSHLISRFNQEGMKAIVPRHGVVPQSNMGLIHGNGFCAKPGANRRQQKTARRPGL